MSAMIALPPPNDSSDSGAKTRASASSVSPKLRMSAAQLPPRQPDTERPQAQYDRDHRPAQYPDAQHGRRRDDKNCGTLCPLDDTAQPGREGEPDNGRRDAVEHIMQNLLPGQLGIGRGE